MSRDILLSLIDPDPGQPRKHFDEASLKELADSIEANGLAQPILLRPSGERFIIIHGERRYRAHKLLGRDTIAAEVRDIAPGEAVWLSLVENVQRSDLSPIEEAQAYQARLNEGITQVELGKRIGKTQSYIAQKLRLLKLPNEIQASIQAGTISEGHARQLLKIDDTAKQIELAEAIARDGLSVAKTQALVDLNLSTITIGGNTFTRLYAIFPDITGKEYESFKADIAKMGIIESILVDGHNGVIDGWQRLRATKDLGLLNVPTITLSDLTEEKKLRRHWSENGLRANYNADQRAAMAVKFDELIGA